MRSRRQQKSMFGKPTLLQTLIVAFVLPLLLTGTLMEYLAWRHERQTVKELAWQLQEEVSDRIEERIDYLTSAPASAAFQMARTLRRGDLNPNELPGWKAYMADQGQVFDDLTFLYFANSASDMINLHQRSGRPDQVSFRDGKQLERVVRYQLIPGKDEVLDQVSQPYDSVNRPWYKAAVAAEQPTWTEPYEFLVTTSDMNGRDRLVEATGITFVVPYYQEFGLEADAEADFVLDLSESKTLLGVIGVDLTLEDLDGFLGRIPISDGGEAFIIDRKGQLIASSYPQSASKKALPIRVEDSDSELIEQTGLFLKAQFGDFDRITSTTVMDFQVGGKQQLLKVQPYSDDYGLDWLMVVVVPESDFLGPIREDLKTRLLLSLLVLGVIVLLILAIAQRINRSMRRLSLASQSIADGNLHQSVPGSFIQEIDTTANAFNQMGQKLEASYAQLKEYSKSLEKKVKERTQSLEQEVRDRTRSEATFRNLVSNIPGTVYRASYSTEWVMEFMSESILEISGYPAEDFVQNRVRSYISVIFPKDLENLLPAAEATINSKEPYVLEYRIRHADGSLRWVYDKGRGVFDDSGKLLYLDGAFFDITSLKKAEQLAQYRGKIDSLLNQVSRALLEQPLDDAIGFALEQIGRFTQSDRVRIFQFSSHGQFQVTHHWTHENSPTYVETRKQISAGTYGWFYQQLISGDLLQFASLDDLPPDAATSKAVLQAQSVRSLLDVPMVHVDQSVGLMTLDTVHTTKVWTASEINLVRLVGEMIAMAQQKHIVEQSLIRAKEKAEVASRAKSEFLASMSHELRSPLNAILGFAQIMESSPHLPSHHQDDVQIISRSGEHLLSLINNVLDMSKIEAGRTTLNPIDFDLHSLLKDIRGMFILSAEQKSLQLTLDQSRNLPRYIYADQGKLKQVLINLLNNAIKFTAKGEIVLSASVGDHDSIRFAVTDTGTGIAPTDIEKVFEPFTQSQSGRDSQEGTGLGLSICRKFVQLMGGSIALQNRADDITGTIVSFSINAPMSSAQSAEKVSPNRDIVGLAVGQPSYKILVVDDKLANRQLLVKLLEPLGLVVKTANDGKDAVEVVDHWMPHLIWMDLRMPVLNGIEATKQIRERMRTDTDEKVAPKIVALSATSFVRERGDAIAAGCDAFIAKPFKTAEIFDCMAEQLGLQYRYANELPNTVPAAEQKTQLLDPESLNQLSPQLLAELENAVLRLQWDKILQLIETISADDEALGQTLTQTIHDFQYSKVLDAIQFPTASTTV